MWERRLHYLTPESHKALVAQRENNPASKDPRLTPGHFEVVRDIPTAVRLGWIQQIVIRPIGPITHKEHRRDRRALTPPSFRSWIL